MRITYGTKNQAKIHSMKAMLKDMDLDVEGLGNLDVSPPITESGATPLENARIKAKAYYKVLKKPVFSCDSGLYLEAVEASEQPGVHVRRVKGRSLTDEEMIEHYSNLAKANGGQIRAHYQNAICLILNENLVFEYEGEKLQSESFIISSVPHKRRLTGFPINSLSVEIASGNYYMDLNTLRKDNKVETGFRQFFEDVLIHATMNRY